MKAANARIYKNNVKSEKKNEMLMFLCIGVLIVSEVRRTRKEESRDQQFTWRQLLEHIKNALLAYGRCYK